MSKACAAITKSSIKGSSCPHVRSEGFQRTQTRHMWTQNAAGRAGIYPHVVRKASGRENWRDFTFLPSKIAIINSNFFFFLLFWVGDDSFLWRFYCLNKWIIREVYNNRFIALGCFFYLNFFFFFY